MSIFQRRCNHSAIGNCYAVCILSVLTLSSYCFAKDSAYVRVNQAGYEINEIPYRAYLMSTAPEQNATFEVLNSSGDTVYSGKVGAPLGIWSHSITVTYQVYALDFNAIAGDIYKIEVTGPVQANSPRFAVDSKQVLYSGLLLNALFFYQTQRDGPNFIANALRTGPAHLKDIQADVYQTPPLDSNDNIDNVPPTPPLVLAGLTDIDASGGWWDAGDYAKYVETTSYALALMEIGIRDFPHQMGANAPVNPPAPPVSVSYAGDSGQGAPRSSDFTKEARFGLDWLMKMWDEKTKTLYYQVDNTQGYNYYGFGNPTSSAPNCGGNYPTAYCLISEYDIWTLPQAADKYQQPGDPQPCDPLTTFFICNRPVFVAGIPGSPISPNLAGRLTADFALCYQLHSRTEPSLANECLKNATEIFELADLSYPDPAPSVSSGSCSNCLLTIVPFGGYPETVWDDDMELGATELYFALKSAKEKGDLPAGLPRSDENYYLEAAANFAHNYITRIYELGFSDTLNLYDVSGLAHFELYRALSESDQTDLTISRANVRKQLLRQVNDAVKRARTDVWGFGFPWNGSDSASHGAGLSVMASEAAYITGEEPYDTYSQRWIGNIIGVNAWGSSFIVGAGTTFPNCIQHQVANLAGALNGGEGGTPVLWGAVSEGPNSAATFGVVQGMNLCPENGGDRFAGFNGNDGLEDPSQHAVYRDNVQSYTTTEPAIDLAASSFLMWSWRLAGQPNYQGRD